MGERDSGAGSGKGPQVGILIRDARSATAMYVGALPTMLSVQTVNSCFIVIYPTLVSRI